MIVWRLFGLWLTEKYVCLAFGGRRLRRWSGQVMLLAIMILGRNVDSTLLSAKILSDRNIETTLLWGKTRDSARTSFPWVTPDWFTP